jgi:hypothetical protein
MLYAKFENMFILIIEINEFLKFNMLRFSLWLLYIFFIIMITKCIFDYAFIQLQFSILYFLVQTR